MRPPKYLFIGNKLVAVVADAASQSFSLGSVWEAHLDVCVCRAFGCEQAARVRPLSVERRPTDTIPQATTIDRTSTIHRCVAARRLPTARPYGFLLTRIAQWAPRAVGLFAREEVVGDA